MFVITLVTSLQFPANKKLTDRTIKYSKVVELLSPLLWSVEGQLKSVKRAKVGVGEVSK